MTNTGKDVAKSHMWCETKVRDIKRRKKKMWKLSIKKCFLYSITTALLRATYLARKNEKGKEKKNGKPCERKTRTFH